MFEVILGSKNVERILIFLFVNEKCYGTQLHRYLNTPLTPLQKTLAKLEDGGVILSNYQGKTRIYKFNPSFPLITELKQLLKKIYTLMPANEKRTFYDTNQQKNSFHGNIKNKLRVLYDFWDKLNSISSVTFSANSKTSDGDNWQGHGRGEVSIEKENSNTIIFNEKGLWNDKNLNFSNVFKWTLDRSAEVISLEHLRNGHDHPVFLFHLAPSTMHSLASVNSYLCEGDTYFGKIHFDQFSVNLNWRIIGSIKNETIDYCYK